MQFSSELCIVWFCVPHKIVELLRKIYLFEFKYCSEEYNFHFISKNGKPAIVKKSVVDKGDTQG